MLLIISVCFAPAIKAQTPTTAYQLKAVFLYNFTQFVDWPPASFNSGHFTIGILGTDPFGSYIESVVAGEKVHGKPITVQRYNDVSEVKNCHILFINKADWPESIEALENRSILTVGDASDFAKAGGMIKFFLENNKIRFQVNLGAIKKANISISSKLLRVADVINQ